MKREGSIELLRVLMMCGIVIEHAISQCGYHDSCYEVDNVLDSCVDGFMFISGWFGIRLKSMKIVRMLGVAIWCGMILNVAETIMAHGDGLFFLQCCKHTLRNWWFFWAYLVVMLLAPLVEAAFGNEKSSPLQFVVPILVLVFGWSYLTIVPVIKNYVPCPYGFAPLSFCSLFGVYVFARAFRLLNWQQYVSKRVLMIGMPMALALALLGEWHHNSVGMLFLAMSWFVLFRGLRLPPTVTRLVLFAGPSMFAVYLLHVSYTGITLLKTLMNYFVFDCHICPVFSACCSGVVCFCVCFCVECVRRLMLLAIEKSHLRLVAIVKE